jgi:hypothetical protein
LSLHPKIESSISCLRIVRKVWLFLWNIIFHHPFCKEIQIHAALNLPLYSHQ